MARPVVGRWRIVEMDLWDPDTIDLVGPAFIETAADGSGWFRFIVVEGHIDFTWDGADEGDQVSGRGWAQLEADGSLRGRILFDAGDDSGFRAVADIPSE